MASAFYALVGSSPAPHMHPRHNQKNDIRSVRDRHHFGREFQPHAGNVRLYYNNIT